MKQDINLDIDGQTFEVSVEVEVEEDEFGIGSYEFHGQKGYDSQKHMVIKDWGLVGVWIDGEPTTLTPEIKKQLDNEIEDWLNNNEHKVREELL